MFFTNPHKINFYVYASIIFIFAVTSGSAAQERVNISEKELKDRGVLFYVPFEKSADATYASGQKEPWVARELLYAPGVYGEGVQLLKNDSHFVHMPNNTLKKYSNANSMLIYEAAGNIYKRRGTIAFWVLSPWDASDRNILTSSSQGGPMLFTISDRCTQDWFFEIYRRKNLFEIFFGGSSPDGNLKRFGSEGKKLIPLWKKDQWHHFAITWDDRHGCAVYHNGNLIDKLERDIDWNMREPDTMALGTSFVRQRDLWPVNAPYMFDELITFARPLTAEEIKLVRDGKYSEIRPMNVNDWPDESKKRKELFRFNADNNRPAFHAKKEDGVKATIKQCAVETVSMKFHRAFALNDGTPESTVVFNDGGVAFDIPAVFHFSPATRINHIISEMKSSKGSYVFEADEKQAAVVIQDGRSHLTIDGKGRSNLGVFFKGNAEGGEFTFYDIQPDISKPLQGKTFYISETILPGQFQDADRTLVNGLNPCDQPALYADKNAAGEKSLLTRKEMAHTFIVLSADGKDRFVDTLRLLLQIKTSKKDFNSVIRVYDPLIDNRIAFDMDFRVVDAPAGQFFPLDLTLGVPGLIIPENGHLVIDLIMDSDCEISYGKETASKVELREGNSKRIGQEFATAQIRNMYPAFERRLNQNRFLQEGENKEKNPIWRGLTLAEKYDPDNAVAKSWFSWSRLKPWPAYDFNNYLDKEPGPQWAVYMREALRSMQGIVDWWIENRGNENGYLVGGGNQWNDITDFYSTFMSLGVTAGDRRLSEMIQKYQDAHWNSGRMRNGYNATLTDALHAMEEATEIQPCLEILNPGLPRNMYRNLNTARNYPKWMGKNSFGHTHFRSNYFNANKMLTDGVFGRDKALSEGATAPGRFVWWYNGHPEIAKLLTAYGDSWLADTLRDVKGKPAGVIPTEVQFETDQLFSSRDDNSRSHIADMFMALYSLTGDKKYFEPVRSLFSIPDEAKIKNWTLYYSRNFIHYRILSEDPSYDRILRDLSKDAYNNFKSDSFFQRGCELYEGLALCKWVVDYDEKDLMEMLKYVIRNNKRAFIPYTVTDPPTDRVYPWGREILPFVMLGGRPFGLLRFSNPVPSAAFAWEGTDPDIVSMVFERKPTSFKMLVYNFKDKAVKAGMRALQLPEGTYNISTAFDDNGDRKPDSAPKTTQLELRRFTPATIEIPSRRTLWVELSLIKERSKTMRPDLAVTPSAITADKVTVQIHNLGCVPAPAAVLRLLDDKGRAIAETGTPEIPGISGFEPQIKELTITVPSGFIPERCILTVDPDNKVDEINESNNSYPLSQGIPPPVETSR